MWVILCMAVGVLIGKFLPQIPDFLNRFEYAKISIPMAILIWLMIYPMMMKVDFKSIRNVGKNPKGIICDVDHKLADKAVYNVRHFKPVSLRDFQNVYYAGTRNGISCGNGFTRSCTLHGYGVRVEYTDERKSCLYRGAGGDK